MNGEETEAGEDGLGMQRVEYRYHYDEERYQQEVE